MKQETQKMRPIEHLVSLIISIMILCAVIVGVVMMVMGGIDLGGELFKNTPLPIVVLMGICWSGACAILLIAGVAMSWDVSKGALIKREF